MYVLQMLLLEVITVLDPLYAYRTNIKYSWNAFPNTWNQDFGYYKIVVERP